jgi:hypothetical protein
MGANKLYKSRKLLSVSYEANDMGASFLDVYEVRWEGQKNRFSYLNIYEKGSFTVPVGLSIKK